MNNTLNLSNVISFVAGAAIGAVVAWKFVEAKYKKIVQEEIESVKEAYSNRDEDNSEEPNIEEPENEECDECPKNEYSDILEGEGYVKYSKKEKEMSTVKRPYVISPNECGDCDYEVVSLTYYADKVLTDEDDIPIQDVDGIVGCDSLNTFGQYEPDSVFVRNDDMKSDYEILLDMRNYSDIVKSKPHLAEDE